MLEFVLFGNDIFAFRPSMLHTTIGEKLGLVHELGLENFYHQIGLPRTSKDDSLVLWCRVLDIFGLFVFGIPTTSASSALSPLMATQAAASPSKDAPASTASAIVVLLVLGSNVVRLALPHERRLGRGGQRDFMILLGIGSIADADSTNDISDSVLDAGTQTSASGSFGAIDLLGRSEDLDGRRDV